ncbi:MAG TPA: DUF2510 domain-containing protein, partial [Ilumatobacteraceae bacterium]|nr:DUF2510 domain-containing protein [Ilumatobacteraceae bacterium]
MTSGADPDWYPDPSGRFEFRYFNGAEWTADVANDGVRFVDPQHQRPAAPIGTVATHATIDPKAGRGTWGLALLALALAWVPFLFVVGFAAALATLAISVAQSRRAGAGVAHPRQATARVLA